MPESLIVSPVEDTQDLKVSLEAWEISSQAAFKKG